MCELGICMYKEVALDLMYRRIKNSVHTQFMIDSPMNLMHVLIQNAFLNPSHFSLYFHIEIHVFTLNVHM